MPRLLRSRKIRFAVFGAAGLLASIGLILGALHTPGAKQIALHQAVLALRKQGIGLEASKLDYSLFSRRVEMRGVRVQSLAAAGLPPLALVDHLSVQIDLRRAVVGAYHLEDAVLSTSAFISSSRRTAATTSRGRLARRVRNRSFIW